MEPPLRTRRREDSFARRKRAQSWYANGKGAPTGSRCFDDGVSFNGKEGYDLAIDHGVVRQLGESVCYGRKPGREVISLRDMSRTLPALPYRAPDIRRM